MNTVVRRIVPLAAITAVLLGLTVWATAGAAAGRASTGSLMNMSLTTKQTSIHADPNTFGPKGQPLVGGALQIANILRVGQTQVGAGVVTCTITSGSQGLCQVALNFPRRGRLELAGLVNLQTKSGLLAITGGTGIYSTARGWARLHSHHLDIVFR